MELPSSALRKSSVVTFSDPVAVNRDYSDEEHNVPQYKHGDSQKLDPFLPSTELLLDLADPQDNCSTQPSNDATHRLLNDVSGVSSVSAERLSHDMTGRSSAVSDFDYMHVNRIELGAFSITLTGVVLSYM